MLVISGYQILVNDVKLLPRGQSLVKLIDKLLVLVRLVCHRFLDGNKFLSITLNVLMYNSISFVLQVVIDFLNQTLDFSGSILDVLKELATFLF